MKKRGFQDRWVAGQARTRRQNVADLQTLERPGSEQRLRRIQARFKAVSPTRMRPQPQSLIVLSAMVFFGVLAIGLIVPSALPKLAMAQMPAEGSGLVGRASVIDGDTLELRGQRIRLSGVDAPESRQSCTDADGASWRCGQKAALALSDHIGTKPVKCSQKGHRPVRTHHC